MTTSPGLPYNESHHQGSNFYSARDSPGFQVERETEIKIFTLEYTCECVSRSWVLRNDLRNRGMIYYGRARWAVKIACPYPIAHRLGFGPSRLIVTLQKEREMEKREPQAQTRKNCCDWEAVRLNPRKTGIERARWNETGSDDYLSRFSFSGLLGNFVNIFKTSSHFMKTKISTLPSLSSMILILSRFN